MPTYEQNKKHIAKYVKTHPEKINEINTRWRHNHLKTHNEKRRRNYDYKIGCDIEIQFKLLRNIDLF